ncbi:MAG: hypothetical protein COA82_10760 [Alkaliphilus sp.]|nr:hypothetical protein [Alkaliphilus sp. AH-315-G20]MBN4074763.1 hypothetical protein [bacterium AH-315-E09]PHS30923.1 MAG: hypothetical protein COA82_10760 [Alkaliphilus sp.]
MTKKINIDIYDGAEWDKVTNVDFLKGIASIDKIKELHECGLSKLQVIYESGEEIFYSNVHGTWGFPTKIN